MAKHARRCSFCGLNAVGNSGLVVRESVSICSRCIAEFVEAMSTVTDAIPVGVSIHREAGTPCRFCDREVPAVAWVFLRNGATVCPDCVQCSHEIVAHHPW